MTAPATYATAEPVAAATTKRVMPAVRPRDPKAAAARGAACLKASCVMEAEPVSAKMLVVVARWLVVWKSSPERVGPSDRNSPAIDHEDTAARAASMNG